MIQTVAFWDGSMRHLISTSISKVKKLWSKLRGQAQTSANDHSLTNSHGGAPPKGTELPPIAAISSPSVSSKKPDHGLYFDDPLPEIYFDDGPEAQQLKQHLNTLLDEFHHLNSLVFSDKEIDPSDLPNILTDDERVTQIAAQFIEDHDWPITALPILEEIFQHLGWAATKTALEEMVNNGMNVQELKIAYHIRCIWESSEKYTQSSRWKTFSWPMALLIIRSFQNYPQLEEVEVFIERLYDRWLNTPKHYKESYFFLSYLQKKCTTLSADHFTEANSRYPDYNDVPFNNYAYSESNDIKRMQQQQRLMELGVI